jgi:hypothetical protein
VTDADQQIDDGAPAGRVPLIDAAEASLDQVVEVIGHTVG